MKNECDIVKDLLPNYIEDLASIETKKYIENHINSCNQCRQALEIMRDDRTSNKNNENQEEKIELNNFKKYRRKILLLKLFSIGFILVLLIIVLSFVLKYNHIDSLMNNLKNKKEELIALDNYSIYTTSHHINYKTDTEDYYYNEYYYKGGKYKTISKSYGINRWRLDGTSSNDEIGISYGIVDTNEQIIINNRDNKIIKYTTNYNINSKIDDLYNAYNSFSFAFKDINNTILKIGFILNNDIQNARFNGRDCYVFRTETKEYYKEIWIDKETLLPIRQVQDIFGQLYDEKTITFYTGNLEDNDVEFDQELYKDYTIEEKEILYDEEVINTLNTF